MSKRPTVAQLVAEIAGLREKADKLEGQVRALRAGLAELRDIEDARRALTAAIREEAALSEAAAKDRLRCSIIRHLPNTGENPRSTCDLLRLSDLAFSLNK